MKTSLKASGKSRADLWAFAARAAADYAMDKNNLYCAGLDSSCPHLYNYTDMNCFIKSQISQIPFKTGRQDCSSSTKYTPINGMVKSMTNELAPGHRYRDYETSVAEFQPNPSSNGTAVIKFFA